MHILRHHAAWFCFQAGVFGCWNRRNPLPPPMLFEPSGLFFVRAKAVADRRAIGVGGPELQLFSTTRKPKENRCRPHYCRYIYISCNQILWSWKAFAFVALWYSFSYGFCGFTFWETVRPRHAEWSPRLVGRCAVVERKAKDLCFHSSLMEKKVCII